MSPTHILFIVNYVENMVYKLLKERNLKGKKKLKNDFEKKKVRPALRWKKLM
jgi:hypothetical protein